MKASAIIALILIVLFVILHLGGRGFGAIDDHVPPIEHGVLQS